MFFPIFVDPKTRKIKPAGDPSLSNKQPEWKLATERKVAWPVRSDGELGGWRIGPATFNSLLEKGYVKLGGFDEKRLLPQNCQSREPEQIIGDPPQSSS
jgi:adenine-specific DNA-methyltransferase